MTVTHWHILRVTTLLGGTLALTGGLLGFFVHPLWFLLSVFVGVMQLIFALTGLCPSAILLAKIGVSPS